MMTYDAADRWLKNRYNLLTDRRTNDRSVPGDPDHYLPGISSSLPRHLRGHVFFSARVAEAEILSEIRRVSDAYTRGEMTMTQAKSVLSRFYAGRGMTVADHRLPPPPGISEARWREASRITNLASAVRMELILEQNALMARGVRRWEETMNPVSLKRRPYLMYVHGANGTPKTPRESHQALHGKVFAKTDPVWSRIFPPNGWRCHCGVRELRESEAREIGISENAEVETPTGGGFEFAPGEAYETENISSVSETVRGEVRKRCEDFVKTEADCPRMTIIADPPEETVRAPRPVPNEQRIREYFSEVEKGMKAGNGVFDRKNMPQETLSLGTIPDEYLNAFGIDPVKAELSIGVGSRKTGLSHWKENHSDQMTEAAALDMLKKTLWTGGNRTVYAMARKKDGTLSKLLIIDNLKENLFLVMTEGDNGFEFVSLSGADEDYRKRNWKLKEIIREIEEE